ncbi:MAG: hypothetical protein IT359_18495 [Gemmatimonadaceae bacterium]|nr:hypothetical protein [Gemmatimonadaceae bacterium]
MVNSAVARCIALLTCALGALAAPLRLAGAQEQPRAQGRVVVDTVRARALLGNRAGDAIEREVWIYLPPSYERDRARRYPVLYLLHGMTSHPREWLDGSYQGFDLRLAMDSLALQGHEYLVVTPHADNAWGGAFYVNSVAFGRWDDFVGRELVGYVDGKYRTMRDRRHRGVAGQSMGGFGALSLAMTHSATFANVYAMSPCCLAMVGELGSAHPVWQRAPSFSLSDKPQNVAESIVRDLSAVFAPTYRTTAPLALPYVVRGQQVRTVPAVQRTWRRFIPTDRVARDPSALKAMCGIVIDYGAQDQIPSVVEGSRTFAAALAKAGIAHTVEVYDGGHVDKARDRFERHLLPYFARVFATTATRPGC